MVEITEEWKDQCGPVMKKAREVSENLSVCTKKPSKTFKIYKDLLVAYKSQQIIATLLTNYKIDIH